MGCVKSLSLRPELATEIGLLVGAGFKESTQPELLSPDGVCP